MQKISRRSLFQKLPAAIGALTIAPLVVTPVDPTSVILQLDSKQLAKVVLDSFPNELLADCLRGETKRKSR